MSVLDPSRRFAVGKTFEALGGCFLMLGLLALVLTLASAVIARDFSFFLISVGCFLLGGLGFAVGRWLMRSP
jgi:hypothetical protein